MGDRFSSLIWLGCIGAEVSALLASRRVATRLPSHVPHVYLFTFALAADVVVKLTERTILAGVPRPFSGVYRALYHLTTMLGTGWPCAVAGLALWVFLPRQRQSAPFVAVGAWLGFNVGIAMAFPCGAVTQRLTFGLEVAAVATVGALIPATWGRRWTSAHSAVLYLAGAELVVTLVGPYATSIYRDWDVATCLYLCAFGALAVWYTILGSRKG